jgi:signal transduction histidine kinase
MVRSVRTRLTIWFTSVLAIPLVLFAVGTLVLLSHAPSTHDAQYVATEQAELVKQVTGALRADSATSLVRLVASPGADITYAIYDMNGHLVAATPVPAEAEGDFGGPPPLALLGREIGTRAALDTVPFPISGNDGEYLVKATTVTLPHGRSVVIAGLLAQHAKDELMEFVTWLVTIAVPLFLILAAAGGYFLAGRALAPMHSVTRRASVISATSLHERLPVENPADEVGALTTVINGLLERLERSFAQQRQFMADASHELRTPVSVIRAEADVALAKDASSPHVDRESMTVVQEAGRHLSRIVEDLFLLARADAGQSLVVPEALYLEDVVTGAVRAAKALADRRGVRIELRAADECPYHGDPDLLARLVLALLDNAAKYSPAGSVVRVTLSAEPSGYIIRVADSGPGIRPEDRERIFLRFVRAGETPEVSDASVPRGAGLGLPIARSIAEAHGGQLRLEESSVAGSEFVVTLPVAHGTGSRDSAVFMAATGSAP